MHHTVSPAMQEAALRAAGLSGSYRPLETPPERLEERLQEVRRGYVGVNVTIPHKESVLAWLDALSPEAQAVGAVNTIQVRDGKLIGHNTDAPGFIAALEEAGIAYRGKRALVLGAGGAARAVVYALREGGAWVRVHNRSLERARALCRDLGAQLVAEDDLETAVLGCDLLVNATSVGMKDPHSSPLPEGLLPRSAAVVDIVYNPLQTRLLREAARAGLPTLGGVPMLVWQGALAFELWTGLRPNLQVMYRAALGVLEGSAD